MIVDKVFELIKLKKLKAIYLKAGPPGLILVITRDLFSGAPLDFSP